MIACNTTDVLIYSIWCLSTEPYIYITAFNYCHLSLAVSSLNTTRNFTTSSNISTFCPLMVTYDIISFHHFSSFPDWNEYLYRGCSGCGRRFLMLSDNDNLLQMMFNKRHNSVFRYWKPIFIFASKWLYVQIPLCSPLVFFLWVTMPCLLYCPDKIVATRKVTIPSQIPVS